jgi:hypothetical protein
VPRIRAQLARESVPESFIYPSDAAKLYPDGPPPPPPPPPPTPPPPPPPPPAPRPRPPT